MSIIDIDKCYYIKRLMIYLKPNEAVQLRDELDKLLKNPESNKPVHIHVASGEIYCNLYMIEKQFLARAKNYLQGAVLRWKKWKQESKGWDHDHCELCFKVFTDIKKYTKNLQKAQKEQQDNTKLLQEGYVTEDNLHWICKECYEKFKKEFQFKVVNTPN